MIYLLNWRLWVLGILLALGPIGYVKGRTDGKRLEKSEWMASVAAANDDARRLERARQSRADEAARTAATREAGLRADAARAGDAVQRLRDALTAQHLAGESAAAAAQRATTYGQLLGESAAAYRELAATCDRHVNDIRLLLEAWPRDPP